MKKKNANIELLRMISMFLIIMHHAVLYSNVLSNYDTSINKYLAAIIYIGGKYGANVFFAITAYFLTEQSFKFERVVSIWKTTFFYGILFFILNFIVEIRSFELKDVLETILPIYYKSYWFVTAYIGLVLLSPFLNVLIHHLNKNAFIILLTIMACMVSIPVTFFPGARPYMDESHLFLCIFIYLVIGFYKKFMRSIPVKKDRLTCLWGGDCSWWIFMDEYECYFNNFN